MAGPAVPPLAALFPVQTTQLDGPRDPAPAATTPCTSFAPPLRSTRGGASIRRQGLLPAATARLAPTALEILSEPARANSARLFAPAKALFARADEYRRQRIDPPQSFEDTRRTAGLLTLVTSTVSAPAIPVRGASFLLGAAAVLPRLRVAPENLAEPTMMTVTAAALAFPARALWIARKRTASRAARTPIRSGLWTGGPNWDRGAAPAPVAAGELWAFANTPSLPKLSLAPTPAKTARPKLAQARGTYVSAALSAGQPRLARDARWRVRLVIWRPEWEPWKSPIRPRTGTETIDTTLGRATPKPRFWDYLPHWHLMISPARAAILAVPLIGFGIALSAITKPVAHPARIEKPTAIESVRAFLRERSELLIEDDFRSGISSWDGGPEWAHSWAYGAAGSVQPRALALLRPSLPLADYRLEFLGQIEKKSLSWVFRATDLKNYYAMKITIDRPGPVPLGAIVRYTMVNGAAVDRVQLPLPLSIRNDTLYRVETSATEDRFVTSINGQVVDTFFDRRHPSGGVGLFSGPDESSRVLWVRVVERDDFLGRLCAYFVSEQADRKTAFAPSDITKKAITEQ
ncbi:MAG TPA: hypothetical protein VG096_25890 [Bryobacteraceae bacterium]|nr:hypothetical protein [Bryobacteraceae bacterium]